MGIYLKISALSMQSFDEWLQEIPNQTRAEILALYLDLAWLEIACRAIVELVDTEIFVGEPESEHSVTASIVARFPELRDAVPRGRHITLLGLATRLRNLRVRLDRSSRCQKPLSGLIEDYPSGQIGHLGRVVGRMLAEYCDSATEDSRRWSFRVCYDESEALSPFGIKTMNTIVRLAEFPVFPVLSFVRLPPDPTSTFLGKGMDLQNADRFVVLIDELKGSEFRELAIGVSSVRLRAHEPEYSGDFNIGETLGHLDLNLLLMDALKKAESESAKEWLKKSQGLANSPLFTTSSEEGEAPPIYQTFLAERLNLQLPRPDSPAWRRRAQKSREIRKRMVAAYLVLFKELRQRPRYAFAEMFLQMSDNCIRDFLLFMDFLFRTSSNQILKGKRVHWRQQAKALRMASDQKRNSLEASGVGAPSEAKRLVEGLATLTALVQGDVTGAEALRSSERGRFVFDPREYRSASDLETIALIEETADTGYLRILDSSVSEFRFRVHTSLAASFDFSYRGAYYDMSIDIRDLTQIRLAEDPATYRRTIDRLAKQPIIDNEPSLFDYE